jgi:hypothetical protein
VSVFVE